MTYYNEMKNIRSQACSPWASFSGDSDGDGGDVVCVVALETL